MLECIFYNTKAEITLFTNRRTTETVTKIGTTQRNTYASIAEQKDNQEKDGKTQTQKGQKRNSRNGTMAIVVEKQNTTYAELLKAVKENLGTKKPCEIRNVRKTKEGNLLLVMESGITCTKEIEENLKNLEDSKC